MLWANSGHFLIQTRDRIFPFGKIYTLLSFYDILVVNISPEGSLNISARIHRYRLFLLHNPI